MESVYLRTKSAEFYVTEEGLKAIRALVMQYRICGRCKRLYDIDNFRACVGFNLCMECLLKQQPDLTFLKVLDVTVDGEVIFAFVDSHGLVYTAHENSSTKAEPSVVHSLLQAGFPVPATYKPFKATETVTLYSHHMNIVGDLNNSVVVLTYSDYYAKINAQFLLYKHGSYKELTKRGEGKVLLDRARSMLEGTKRNGRYWIDGREVWSISDYEIYKVVAQLESAVYDISKQFVLPEQPEQAQDESIIGSIEPEPEPEEKPKRGRKPQLSIVPAAPETVVADLNQELAQPEDEELASESEEATSDEDTEPMQPDENA